MNHQTKPVLERRYVATLRLSALFLGLLLLLSIVFQTAGYQITGKSQGETPPAPGGDDRDAIAATLTKREAVDIIVWLKDNEFTSPAYQQDLAKKSVEIKKLQSAVLATLSEDFRLKFAFTVSNGFAGAITREGFEKLDKDGRVAKIFLDRTLHLALPQSRPLINATTAEKIGFTGAGVTVCVTDTGIDYTHTSLGGCLGPSCKVKDGFDYYNSDSNPMDDDGHGTHVAGIVASSHPLNRGIAPKADLAALKVCGNSGAGCPSSAMIAGVDWCVANAQLYNIKVITMSIGDNGEYTTSNCPTWIDPSFQNAYNAGIFSSVASDNEAHTAGISYPACSPWVASVGATYDANVGAINWGVCTDLTTTADQIVCFTNRGSNLDLLAPGAVITSTSSSAGNQCGAPTQNGFGSCSGTSMATPHVAGLAALLYHADPNLNHASIETIMKNTGKPIFDSATGLTFPRIDALAAVAPYDTPPSITLPDLVLNKNSGTNGNVLYLPNVSSDNEIPSTNLTFTILSQTNPSVVSCSIDVKKFLDCTVVAGAAGFSDITIEAFDGLLAASDTMTITVPNTNPVITSSPITKAAVNTEYLYDVNAVDADNDPLTYALLQFPQGMTIDPVTGLISWQANVTLPTMQFGNKAAMGAVKVNVSVQASDGMAADTQNFTLTVSIGKK